MSRLCNLILAAVLLGMAVPAFAQAPAATPAAAENPALDQGRKQLAASEFAGAKATAETILAAEPNNAAALNLRGAARMGLNDKAGAKADFDAAIRLDPSLWKALRNRAMVNVALGAAPAVVLADLDAALEHNPADPAMLRQAGGWCINKQLGADRCAAYYQRLITLFPTAAPGYQGFAHAYIAHYDSLPDKSGLAARVGPYLQKAASLAPKSSATHVLYAMLFLKSGKADLALASAQRAAAIDGNDAWAKEWIAKARAAGGKDPAPAPSLAASPAATRTAPSPPPAQPAPAATTSASAGRYSGESGMGAYASDGTAVSPADAARRDRVFEMTAEIANRTEQLNDLMDTKPSRSTLCNAVLDYYAFLQNSILPMKAALNSSQSLAIKYDIEDPIKFAEQLRTSFRPLWTNCL